MVAGNGVPIRLVQENGNLINLTATRLTMSTERKVGSHPVHFMGSGRFSFDMNLNTALILIDGVFVDDQIGETVGSYHEASIDFAANEFATIPNLTAFIAPSQPAVHAGVANGRKLAIARADGTVEEIIISKGTGSTAAVNSGHSDNGNTKSIEIGPEAGYAGIATAFKTYINDELSAHFTASTQDGVANGATTTNGVLKIVQKSFPDNPDATQHTPRLSSISTGGNQFDSPDFYTFAGGNTSKTKSAGDKVQDLYGILNNSKRNSAARRMGTAAVSAINPLGLIMRAISGESVGDVLQDSVGLLKKDYIVGIQIPFNSKIEVTGSSEYEGRFFYMPTGGRFGVLGEISPDKKGSEEAPLTSTTFDVNDQWTGISGTVSKMDINYDAGESVYGFTMQFLPINWMV